MKNMPQRNYPAFYAAAAAWTAAGYEVLNPADLDPDGTGTWDGNMRASLRLLSTAEAVAVLPGWKHSTGAGIEVYTARACGWRVYDALRPESLTEILDPLPHIRALGRAYLCMVARRIGRAARRAGRRP